MQRYEQVISFEREAYVATVLAGDADVADAAEAYLSAVMSREPAEPRRPAATSATR